MRGFRGRGGALLGAVAIAGGVAAWGGGCSGETAPVAASDAGVDAAVTPPDDAEAFGEGGQSQLAISPANATIDVSIVDGVLTTKPVTFVASQSATPVAASWSLDRGELGALVAATGVLTASGTVGGTGTVTATFGSLTATTKVSVNLRVVQNGGAPCVSPGAGGCGGVGGEGLGGPVDAPTQAALRAPGSAPASASELGWLYPYDATLWPRGLLPPLLQWQTTHAVSAVYIHLRQTNYEFEGFYSGSSLVHQPIDEAAWKAATYGNAGDPLHVEITVAEGGKSIGPIAENWKVAPGSLKGTIYYTEYSNTNPRFGAEMAIKPGSGAPTYATGDTSCRACHEVSADGSTLFSTIGNTSDQAASDLRNNGQTIATYSGNAPDNTPNAFKFTFSAPYPDGTFAMASSHYTLGVSNVIPKDDDSYAGDSNLFRRADGTTIPTTGWTGAVTTAVTPAFSPDGKRLAFNFWEGQTTGGVAPGNGHTLAVMDFSCGSADGGSACGSPPYAFSNLRALYNDKTNVPGWPAFLPAGDGVVFHMAFDTNLCTGTGCGTFSKPPAELWWVDVPKNPQTAPTASRLDALDGLKGGVPYLPRSGSHPSDETLSYKPTVVPISVGGYSWVVFISRRLYGNVITGDPFARADNVEPCSAKLWVAALDSKVTPGKDPSHPAFYLPGQNLMHANMHGFWAPDPCQADGSACASGDACCGGYCRPVDGGSVCANAPVGCAQVFEKCGSDADCCGGAQGVRCVNARCASPQPN